MKKGLWVEIRTERHHAAITVTGKTDSAWGNGFNLSAIKSE